MLSHVFTKSLGREGGGEGEGEGQKLVTVAVDSTEFFRVVKNQFWITRVVVVCNEHKMVDKISCQ